jgi:hypothetical protein
LKKHCHQQTASNVVTQINYNNNDNDNNDNDNDNNIDNKRIKNLDQIDIVAADQIKSV